MGSRTMRKTSKCLNLRRDQCVGECEYIITRKGKAKQYCRKKTRFAEAERIARERGRRAAEYALAKQVTREQKRNAAERARAVKLAEHRVEAEQQLAHEKSRNAAERARAVQLNEQRAEAEQQLAHAQRRNAAERARAVQLNEQRAEAEQQLAHTQRNAAERAKQEVEHKLARERGLTAAERARAKHLAEQGAMAERRNEAERARAVHLNEQRAEAEHRLAKERNTTQRMQLHQQRTEAEQRAQQMQLNEKRVEAEQKLANMRNTAHWDTTQQALHHALDNVPVPLPLVYRVGKNYIILNPAQVNFVHKLKQKYMDEFGDANYYLDGNKLLLELNYDPINDRPIHKAKLALKPRGSPGPVYYFTPDMPYTLLELPPSEYNATTMVNHRWMYKNSPLFSLSFSDAFP
jgi:hypothetical protein